MVESLLYGLMEHKHKLTTLFGRGVGVALLSLAVTLFLFMGTVAAEPVEIADAEDLEDVGTDLTAEYVLVDDIDASGLDRLEPIGEREEGEMFMGSLNGNGYSIYNLSVNGVDEGYAGLFAAVGEEGQIENLALENVEVHGDDVTGGVVGYNAGTVVESFVSGDVEGARTGGLVGWNNGAVVDAYSTANVSGNVAGGLIGVIDLGGASGFLPDGDVEPQTAVVTSYTAGEVEGEDAEGGLVGFSEVELSDPRTVYHGVYWDVDVTGVHYGIGQVAGVDVTNSDGFGGSDDGDLTMSEHQGTGLSTDEMQGDAAREYMELFDFDGTWATTEEYPELAQRGTAVGEVYLDERLPDAREEDFRDDGEEMTGDERPDDQGLPGFTVWAVVLLIVSVAVTRMARR